MYLSALAHARRWILVGITLLLALASLPAHAKRVALVVGNANYQVGRLTNPPNDVAEMERALKAVGFNVQKVLNANQNQMKRAVRDFGTAAQGAEVAFVYFSGHGTQANGENYLLPVGASIEKESDYAIEALAANDVLAQIRGAQPKAAILVLDACRDNPLAATTKSTTKGLSRMSAPTGSLIAFATEPNTVASDNGNYAKVLAREIQRPGQELLDVFRNTGAEVKRLSGGKQEPRISEVSINERLYLAGQGTQVASADVEGRGKPIQADPEEEAWAATKAVNNASAYDAYLTDYPLGKFASAARIARAGVSTVVANKTPSASSNPQPGQSAQTSGAIPFGQTPVPPSLGNEQHPTSFIWPAVGQVVDTFSEKYKGIGIAGTEGDPVVAAADGRVIYSGAGPRGYGNLIIVRHDYINLTAYAHNRKLLVIEDQEVKQGERIAEMGSTDAIRVKLHFEIRRSGKPVDPTKFLPAR